MMRCGQAALASNHSVNQLLAPPWQLQPPVSYLDDVEGGNDVSIDGRGRRNASDARMLARDDAHDQRRSANFARRR